MIEIIRPDKDVMEAIKEILSQNRLILEHNLEISKLLSNPPTWVEDTEVRD
jgi:hypothetical protein